MRYEPFGDSHYENDGDGMGAGPDPAVEYTEEGRVYAEPDERDLEWDRETP